MRWLHTTPQATAQLRIRYDKHLGYPDLLSRSSNLTIYLKEFAVVKATEVAVKPASWSFEDAASLPYVLVHPCRKVVARVLGKANTKSSDLFCRVAFMTAVSALHESLGIVLPFLRCGRSEGFKPRSVLVSQDRKVDSDFR
jgi:hypothetical protein